LIERDDIMPNTLAIKGVVENQKSKSASRNSRYRRHFLTQGRRLDRATMNVKYSSREMYFLIARILVAAYVRRVADFAMH
jgi:hypothetical protein